MSQAREELLRAVRGAEDPSAADEERVLRALQGAIAANQVTHVSARVEASLGAQGALPASLALPAVKLLGLALLAITAVVALVRRPSAESARSALPSAAQVRSAAPARHIAAPDPTNGAPDEVRHAADAGAEPAPASGAVAPGTPPPAPARRAARAAKPRDLPAVEGEKPPIVAELSLLRRVQASLRRRDGARALSELQAYPRGEGVLRAERDAARILALCLLGRTIEAREAAARFVREHPGSAQRAAVDASCANSKRNDAL